jgi:hypothetical protein
MDERAGVSQGGAPRQASIRLCNLVAREMTKEYFRREVEEELTGKEREPSDLINFKVCRVRFH